MNLVDVRKRSLSIETTFHEGGPRPDKPLRIAAASAVITNPYAGMYEPDLIPFMAELRSLGGVLAEELVSVLGKENVEVYGKAAISMESSNMAPFGTKPEAGRCDRC